MKKLLLLALLSPPLTLSVRAMDLGSGLSGVWIDEANSIEMLNTSLLNAFKGGDLATAETLLSNPNIDVNAQYKYGQSPLCIAVFKKYTKTAELLIEAGADLNIQGLFGYTLLHSALASLFTRNTGDEAKFLISAGADLNIQDHNGQTPLYMASRHGHTEIAKLLIQSGADLNIQALYGETSLHTASARGYIDIAKLLIQNGANLLALNKYQEKPSDVAKNDIIKAMLLTAESNLTAVANQPSITEKELNKSFAKAGLKLTVPKDAYFKMLYHGAPIKLTNEDTTYLIDLCTVYNYFIENDKLDELKALVLQHGFTDEQCKKLGWGFFPSKNVIEDQNRLLRIKTQQKFTDLNYQFK